MRPISRAARHRRAVRTASLFSRYPPQSWGLRLGAFRSLFSNPRPNPLISSKASGRFLAVFAGRGSVPNVLR